MMENSNFHLLTALAEERFELYRLAGHQSLSPDQIARIHTITDRLAVVWDQYRRDVAGESRDSIKRAAAENRYKALDTWAPAEREDPAGKIDAA